MWSVSVILKTTLIKHRHDKEKFDADHFYGGYRHHHHHYHHHHHHHKHHYCYKVQKPLLSICLSSELSLSILFSSNFICNHFCHHSPFFCCCFVWYLFYFIIIILGGREWWGWLTSLGYLSGLCSGPWHLTFSLGWLKNLSFFILIISWAP